MQSSNDYEPEKLAENKSRRLWEELARWKELKRRGTLLVRIEGGKIVDIQAQTSLK